MKNIIFIFFTVLSVTYCTAQQKNENHSIKIKYSSNIYKEDFAKTCETISKFYPNFDCSKKNTTIEIENKEEYLYITIKRNEIRLVLETSNPENMNIEKIHKLEKQLDAY